MWRIIIGAIGAALVLLVIAEAFSHEEILNRGGRIVFGSRLFGLWTHRNEFDKQSIEEIALMAREGGAGRVHMSAAGKDDGVQEQHDQFEHGLIVS